MPNHEYKGMPMEQKLLDGAGLSTVLGLIRGNLNEYVSYSELNEAIVATPALTTGITIGTVTVGLTPTTFYAPDNVYFIEIEEGGEYIPPQSSNNIVSKASGITIYRFKNDADNYNSILARIQSGQNVVAKFDAGSPLRSLGSRYVYYHLNQIDDTGLVFTNDWPYVDEYNNIGGAQITTLSISSHDSTISVYSDTPYIKVVSNVDPSEGWALAEIAGTTIYIPHEVYNVDIDVNLTYQSGTFINNDSFNSINQKILDGTNVFVRLFENNNLYDVLNLSSFDNQEIRFQSMQGLGSSAAHSISGCVAVISSDDQIYIDGFYLDNDWNNIFGKPDLNALTPYVTKSSVISTGPTNGTAIASISGVTIYAPEENQFIVHISNIDATAETCTVEESYAEISSAIDSGKVVVATIVTSNESTGYSYLISSEAYVRETAGGQIIFYFDYFDSEELQSHAWSTVYIHSDDTSSYVQGTTPRFDEYVPIWAVTPVVGVTGTAIATISGKTIYAPNPSVPVTSVNGATGNVVLDAEDIAYSATQSIKDKIDDIVTAGGEPNVIETVKVNGTALTPTNKEVNVIVPTKVSDLTNDSSFISGVTVTSSTTGATIATVDGKSITVDSRMAIIASSVTDGSVTTSLNVKTLSNSSYQIPAYSTSITKDSQVTTKKYVDDAITSAVGDITGVEFNTSYTTYASLPTTGESGVIYLIPNSGSTPNIYDEYIYASGSYEKIGTTETDLSGYVKTSDLATVATSGSYNDLTNKPSIPTAASFTSTYDSRYALASHTHNYSKVGVSQTQTSGAEIGKITVDNVTTTLYAPTVDLTPYATKTYAEGLTSGLVKTTDLTSYVAKTDVTPIAGVTGTAIATISGKTIYAPVAEGGVQTETDPVFQASAASTITATNISNWNRITTVVSNVQSDWNATTGASVILNKPTIPSVPTNVSAFTNDANYITSTDLAGYNYITASDAPVKDVQVMDAGGVTYSSVLNDGVAQINLSGYATVQQIAGFANISDVTERINQVRSEIPTTVGELTNDAAYVSINDITASLTTGVSIATIQGSGEGNNITLYAPAAVQSDWNVTTTTSLAYIQNKPEVGYHSAQLVIDGNDNLTFEDPNDTFDSLLARIENNQPIRLGTLSGDLDWDINIEDTYYDANTINFTNGKQRVILSRTSPTITIENLPDYSGFYIVDVQEQSGNYSLLNDTAASIIDRYDHGQVMYVREYGRPQLFSLFQIEDARDGNPSTWTLGFQLVGYDKYEEFLISNSGTVTYSTYNYVAVEYNSTNNALDITT